MENNKHRQQKDFLQVIRDKESQKIKAHEKGNKSIWLGLGMFGIVGWSIALPMILGIILGMWLDKNFPGKFPWTLSLLFGGLAMGCYCAYYWISKENRQIDDDQKSEVKKDE